MGWDIIEETPRRGTIRAVFIDSVSDTAFGPVMDYEHVEGFTDWIRENDNLGSSDPREFSTEELCNLYGQWKGRQPISPGRYCRRCDLFRPCLCDEATNDTVDASTSNPGVVVPRRDRQ